MRTGGFKYKSKFVKSGDFGSAGEDIEQIEITSWVDAGAASSLTRMEKQVGPSGRSTLQLTGETTAEREGVNTSSIKVASPKTEFKR